MTDHKTSEEILATPCPHCGILRGEHDIRSLMPHALIATGLTEDDAYQVWGRTNAKLASRGYKLTPIKDAEVVFKSADGNTEDDEK